MLRYSWGWMKTGTLTTTKRLCQIVMVAVIIINCIPILILWFIFYHDKMIFYEICHVWKDTAHLSSVLTSCFPLVDIVMLESLLGDLGWWQGCILDSLLQGRMFVLYDAMCILLHRYIKVLMLSDQAGDVYITYSGENWLTQKHKIGTSTMFQYSFNLQSSNNTIFHKTLRNFIKRLLSYYECRRNRVTTDYCNINALENIVAC